MPPAPIVTSRFSRPDGHTLAAYLETGGYEGLRKAFTMEPASFIEEVKTSGLTGRSGGAAFLTGQKWDLLAAARPAYVVVNGDESEVGFAKVHVFSYSPRPGTAAAARGPTVPPGVVAERRARLLALEREVAERYALRLVGRRLDVEFLMRLRDTVRFAGPAELREQLARDVSRARETGGLEQRGRGTVGQKDSKEALDLAAKEFDKLAQKAGLQK